MTSWGHPSAPERPQGAPAEPTPPEALAHLWQQFPRLPPHLTALVESTCHTLQKVRQGLREHHKQAENFLWTTDPWRGPPGFRAGQEPASPEAPPRPAPPRRSGLQGPHFEDEDEDVVATRSSDWLTQRSAADDAAARQPDTPASWDSEPRLWQDVLTERLWRIFAGTHDEGQQPPHRPTEQALGAECQDPGPRYSGLEPRAEEDPSVFSPPMPSLSSPEGSLEGSPEPGTEAEGALSRVAQEPAGRAYAFLKPICWDPEDFEDTWKRPDALPWRSRTWAVPHRTEKVRTLKHGEPVLATAVSGFGRHAFTCGRGGVKVWSLAGQVAEDRSPESHLCVQARRAYLRTCLLSADSTTLLTGGHNLAGVGVWDLPAPSLHMSGELPCAGLTCQALASSPEDSLALAGFTDGTVRLWDLRDLSVVRDLPGHPNGARSIAVKGRSIWAGGLDARLRCWDLRAAGAPQEYPFESQIMSLSPSPREDWVLVGTANGQQWLQPTRGGQKHMVGSKDGAVLGLKFSPFGQWWVSVGTDDLVGVYSMPEGAVEFQVPEASSILCCDVSPNNRLLVTGSRDHASVYQVTY